MCPWCAARKPCRGCCCEPHSVRNVVVLVERLERMSPALITHLAAAALAAWGAWTFQAVRMDAAVAEVRLEQSNERHAAVTQARADERAVNKTYQEALNAAQNKARSLRRDRDAAQSESDGLRSQLSDAARRIADAPPTAVTEYAAAVSELLGVCSRERTYFAGQADGHALDAATCRAAWPVIPNPRRPAGGTNESNP
jgi:septal ring factor EnvC (AmiA/AmiB activator)